VAFAKVIHFRQKQFDVEENLQEDHPVLSGGKVVQEGVSQILLDGHRVLVSGGIRDTKQTQCEMTVGQGTPSPSGEPFVFKLRNFTFEWGIDWMGRIFGTLEALSYNIANMLNLTAGAFSMLVDKLLKIMFGELHVEGSKAKITIFESESTISSVTHEGQSLEMELSDDATITIGKNGTISISQNGEVNAGVELKIGSLKVAIQGTTTVEITAPAITLAGNVSVSGSIGVAPGGGISVGGGTKKLGIADIIDSNLQALITAISTHTHPSNGAPPVWVPPTVNPSGSDEVKVS
jgi:hypothetical protein